MLKYTNSKKRIKLRYTGSMDMYDSKACKNRLSTKNMLLKPINDITKNELGSFKTFGRTKNNNFKQKSAKTRQYKINFSYTCNSETDDNLELIDPEIVDLHRLDESTTNSDREFVSAKLKPVMTKVIKQLIIDYKHNKSSDNNDILLNSIGTDISHEINERDDTLKGNYEKNEISILSSCLSNDCDDISETFKQKLVPPKRHKTIRKHKSKCNHNYAKDDMLHYYYNKPVEIFILKYLNSVHHFKHSLKDVKLRCKIVEIKAKKNRYTFEKIIFNASIIVFLKNYKEVAYNMDQIEYSNGNASNISKQYKYNSDNLILSEILFQSNYTEIENANHEAKQINRKNQIYLNVVKCFRSFNKNIDENVLLKQLYDIIYTQENKVNSTITNDDNLSNNVLKKDKVKNKKITTINFKSELTKSKSNLTNQSTLRSISPIAEHCSHLTVEPESTIKNRKSIKTIVYQSTSKPNVSCNGNKKQCKYINSKIPSIANARSNHTCSNAVKNLDQTHILNKVEKQSSDEHKNSLLQQYSASEDKMIPSPHIDVNQLSLIANQGSDKPDSFISLSSISSLKNNIGLNDDSDILNLLESWYEVIQDILINTMIDQSLDYNYNIKPFQNSIVSHTKKRENMCFDKLYDVILNQIRTNIIINTIDTLHLHVHQKMRKNRLELFFKSGTKQVASPVKSTFIKRSLPNNRLVNNQTNILQESSVNKTKKPDFKSITTSSSIISDVETVSSNDTENDFKGNMENISYERELVLSTIKHEDQYFVEQDLMDTVTSDFSQLTDNAKLKAVPGYKNITSCFVNKTTDNDTVLTPVDNDNQFPSKTSNLDVDDVKLFDAIKGICDEKFKNNDTLESKLNDIIKLLSTKSSLILDNDAYRKRDYRSNATCSHNFDSKKMDKLFDNLEIIQSTHDKLSNSEIKIDLIINKLDKIINGAITKLNLQNIPSSIDKEIQVNNDFNLENFKKSNEKPNKNSSNNEPLLSKDIIESLKETFRDPKLGNESKFNEINQVLTDVKEAIESFRNKQVYIDPIMQQNEDKALVYDLLECITGKVLHSLDLSSKTYIENRQTITNMRDKLKSEMEKISNAQFIDKCSTLNQKNLTLKRTKQNNLKRRLIKTSSLDGFINNFLTQNFDNQNTINKNKIRSVSATEFDRNEISTGNISYLQHTIPSIQHIQPKPAVKYQTNNKNRGVHQEVIEKSKRLLSTIHMNKSSTSFKSKEYKNLLANLEQIQNTLSTSSIKFKQNRHPQI